MTESGPGNVGDNPEPEDDASVDAIQADIEQTREDLGETVSQLKSEFDVKSKATAQVERAKEQAEGAFEAAKSAVSTETGSPNRNGWIAIAAFGACIVLGGVLIAKARTGSD